MKKNWDTVSLFLTAIILVHRTLNIIFYKPFYIYISYQKLIQEGVKHHNFWNIKFPFWWRVYSTQTTMVSKEVGIFPRNPPQNTHSITLKMERNKEQAPTPPSGLPKKNTIICILFHPKIWPKKALKIPWRWWHHVLAQLKEGSLPSTIRR